MRRILVTGGAGFIGSRVVARLEAGGADVRVLDLAGERAGRGPGDVRDLDTVTAAGVGVDCLVHLAAKVGLGVDLDDLGDYASHNDVGTAVVLQAAARAGVPRVVYASSMVVYGEGAYDCALHGRVAPAPRTPDDLAAGHFEPGCPTCDSTLAPALVTEDAPTDPRNFYAATKLHGEHLLSCWARESGGTGVALRFHNVYGRGMPRDTPYAGVAALFRSALAAGDLPRVFEDGGQRRDFVHVDDVAAAVGAAVCADGPGEGATRAYNIGSGTVTTVGQMAAALSRAVGGPEPLVTGEFRLGDVRHVTASSDRAASELGWRARIALDDGITDVLGT